MRLEVVHRTAYAYEAAVRGSKNEARMTPAKTLHQTIEFAALSVDPAPTHRSTFRDYFGTVVEWFEVIPPHDHLAVTATAIVTRPPDPPEVVRGMDPNAVEYLYPSPMVVWHESLENTAALLRGGSPEDSVRAVTQWLHAEMTYEQGTTVVGTPVADVVAAKRGVCQDYAHVCCAMLRALDIPARYVSGYFAPREIAGGESVDAESHAWVEAYVPGRGWWSVDPTNDIVAGERHVKVGHGRDYSDVVPLSGAHIGAAGQELEVSVTIRNVG